MASYVLQFHLKQTNQPQSEVRVHCRGRNAQAQLMGDFISSTSCHFLEENTGSVILPSNNNKRNDPCSTQRAHIARRNPNHHDSDAMSTLQDSVPLSAVKHLEPYPGGRWVMTGENKDSMVLTYVLEGAMHNVSYTVHRCSTEEDIHTHCRSQLYTFVPRKY